MAVSYNAISVDVMKGRGILRWGKNGNPLENLIRSVNSLQCHSCAIQYSSIFSLFKMNMCHLMLFGGVFLFGYNIGLLVRNFTTFETQLCHFWSERLTTLCMCTVLFILSYPSLYKKSLMDAPKVWLSLLKDFKLKNGFWCE